ncbi:MAG: AMP-binding protein, partial [Clostridia bacterium]|nr:AMP-binding protein [Clostridia bacterium]
MKPWLKNYGAIPHNLEYSDKTVYQLLEATAEKYPTNVAYEFMGRSVNYRDFLSEVKLTAKAFSAVGVKAGDRVAVALPNVPQALGSFYGLNMIGAVPVMLHPLSAPKRILDCLKENGSSFIVCLDLLCSGFVNALKESEAEVTVLMASVEGGLPFFQ